MKLSEALATKQVLVVCGSGGVGKTSVSAALALAASRDRRAIVVTIDPAKRLASALGLSGGLGHEAAPVDVPGASGTLHAAMLDMKMAWDELVERYSPSREVAERIRTNRLYQSLSEHFVGSQGYMAMEQLIDLHQSGDYDLVVVDTPPTRHALDFLEAPKRMTDFVGGSLLRWFAKPYTSAGKLGVRAFNITASPFLRIADRVLGSQVLEDLSEFVLDFQTLYDDFKRRATDVLALLRRDITGFVVVTTLEGPPLGEATFFIDRLVDEGMPLAGIVANKVIPQRFASEEAAAEIRRLDDLDPQTISVPVDAFEDVRTSLVTLHDLAVRDRDRLAELRRRAKSAVAPVPLLTSDVHDLEGLERLAGYALGD